MIGEGVANECDRILVLWFHDKVPNPRRARLQEQNPPARAGGGRSHDGFITVIILMRSYRKSRNNNLKIGLILSVINKKAPIKYLFKV